MAKARLGIRRRARACVALLTVALLALSVAAASASALPARFWGVVPQGELSPEQFQRLDRGGVRSMRVTFDWSVLQATRNGPINWNLTDPLVERAAQSGISVFPFLTGAPSWAVPAVNVAGGHGTKAPAHLPAAGAASTAWQSFLKQVVQHYGPTGTFWSQHPAVPVVPIRYWQVWNEPNFKYFVAKPNPVEYGKLVATSHSALTSVDPGAKVVLAGLFARPKGARNPKTGKHKSLNWYAKDFLEVMYKRSPGIKADFFGVALHPYTTTYKDLPDEIEEIRNLLKLEKDSAKGLWISELGWSSEPPDPVTDQFAKGLAGQARELRGAFTLLRNKQAPWKIQQVDWFSVDDADGACNFCGGSGLFGSGFKPKKAWYEYVKFAGGTP